MPFRLAFLTAVCLAAAPAAPAAELPAGNWVVTLNTSPVFYQQLGIVKAETKDGKPVLSAVGEGLAVSDLGGAGSRVTFNAVFGGRIKVAFEGTVDPKSPKLVVGNFDDGERTYRAMLEATDKDKLDNASRAGLTDRPAELVEAQKLLAAPRTLRQSAAKSKDQDADARAKLEKDVAAAQKLADEKVPELYKKTLAAHPDTPAAEFAAESLLASAAKLKATPAEVGTWAAAVESAGKKYGPRFAQATVSRLAGLLGGDAYAPLALDYAARAAAQPGLSAKARVRVLKLLAAAQTKLGQADAAAATGRELAKLDGELDAEYLKTVPPFAPAKYAGRTDKAANRVAVVELFTGAECPPCVAADVGFDALIQAYPARDVVLLQYHVHIPGPDPLTNADTEARFRYYADKSERAFGGAPATAFDGKPAAGGGGPMDASKDKFDEYKKLVDKALEQSTDVKLAGSVTAAGDTMTVAVEVAGLANPKESVKLRLVLVEDTIKYAGGNGVRFHHHVVRGLLGGADGVPVATLKGGKHTATVAVPELRAGLTAYLSKADADRPFPNPDRPLALKDLKVVALVQDDATGAILQAATLGVGGK